MNRRDVLLAAGVAGLPAPAGAAPHSIGADLAHYAGLGVKLTGGPGDQASGAWLEQRLGGLGFTTRRQRFRAPFFDTAVSTLDLAGQAIPVLPQAPWRATGAEGVSGRLVRWPGAADAKGAIAVIELPFRRWSAFKSPEVEPVVRRALAAGAAAVVLITTGPTAEALALNVVIEAPAFAAPVVILAPKAAEPVLKALDTGVGARLTVTGQAGEREAFNVIGTLDRGAKRSLVISTPRSGWFTCAGERGTGIAVWLGLAEWAARTKLPVNVVMTSASGHEREYAGAKLFLKHEAPPPEQTAFWLHLGANVAARDWHERAPLTPLPSADPQRFLVVEPSLLPDARRAFKGQPGFEAPYGSNQMSDGELGEILAAGYARAAGCFGAHRFHHATADDLRCVEPAHSQAALAGFRALLADTLPRMLAS